MANRKEPRLPIGLQIVPVRPSDDASVAAQLARTVGEAQSRRKAPSNSEPSRSTRDADDERMRRMLAGLPLDGAELARRISDEQRRNAQAAKNEKLPRKRWGNNS